MKNRANTRGTIIKILVCGAVGVGSGTVNAGFVVGHRHRPAVQQQQTSSRCYCSTTKDDDFPLEIFNSVDDSRSSQRRNLLLSAPTLLGLSGTWLGVVAAFTPINVAVAASISTFENSNQNGGGGAAGESIRRSASNLPGLGPSDVFYPASFVGSWTLTRQVVLPSASQNSAVQENVLSLKYPVRYLSSIDANGQAAAVADRGYNQAGLENALRKSTSTASNAVQSYTWSVSNPNVLRLFFSNGSTKEIKVTKRATSSIEATQQQERSSGQRAIESSEFQRVTMDDQTIPVISARRVLTKWKVLDGNTAAEGLELVYDMGSVGGDPLAFATQQQQQQQQPKLLSKSRLRIERVS